MLSLCDVAATSNQRWNDVVYVKVGVYNAGQRRINHFQPRALNVDQRRNNVVNMTICKKVQNKPQIKRKTIFLSLNKNHLKLNTLNSKF